MEIAIVGATRTPIGKFMSGYKDISSLELGEACIKSMLNRSSISSEEVDEVIMGNVLQTGLGQNPARQVSIRSGIPQDRPSYTINQVCGSGMKAIQLACQSILLGDRDVVIAGGMENMSQSPHYIPESRKGYKMGHTQLKDSMLNDGLWCAMEDYHMGMTAENLRRRYNISREEQDQFALESHKKAVNALKEEAFSGEITPIKTKKDWVNIDESPRKDINLDALSSLKPAFEDGGTVTAGNSSSLNDGAATVMLMSKEKAEKLNVNPLAYIKGYSTVAVDPSIMGIAPAYAIRSVLDKNDISLKDIDLIESNEAFAAQSLAVEKELGWDRNKVNINGGAIALGHPIGASGSRILVTLINQLIHKNKSNGVASLCVGGGQGLAMLIER